MGPPFRQWTASPTAGNHTSARTVQQRAQLVEDKDDDGNDEDGTTSGALAVVALVLAGLV